MSLTIESDEIDRLAERLASLSRVDKAEAVRSALLNELERREGRPSLGDRLRPLLDRIDAVPNSGLPADKAFYDDLNGEP